MLRKTLLLTLILSLGLTACGTLEISLDQTPTPDFSAQATLTALQAQNDQLTSALATLAPGEQFLSLESTSEEIQQTLLKSARNWLTVWLDGTLKDYASGTEIITHEQVWIDQSQARFRFLSGPASGEAQRFKASDGYSILTLDIPSGASQMSTMPEGIAGQYIPTLTPGMAFPNPIWGQLGERLAQLAFPADFAQNEGTFKPIRLETVAGRQTLVVEWTYLGNSQPSWRAWVDLERGIFLKEQDFGKGGGDQIQSEIIVDQVAFDSPYFTHDLFSVQPATTPRFSDLSGNPLVAVTPGPTIPAGNDPLGDIYFFALTPGDDANGARYLRLPAACVIGTQTCPEAETLALPGKTYANNGSALAWSRDWQKVAFVATDDVLQAQLFVAEMPALNWKQVAEFYSIELPRWSFDGSWLSFRVQDGLGSDDYYAIRADGSGLKNITANPKLPTEDRPFLVDGWLGNNLIVRSAQPGREAQVYLVNIDNEQVKPLFETFSTKAIFYPSPDGSILAFDEYNYENSVHILRVIAPDGSGLRDLGSFKNTIYPIVWSTDLTTLAFAVYGDNQNVPQATVYVIGRDGRNFKQLYTGDGTQSLAFSPDGQYLLVEDGNRQQIQVINLITLESHTLQAPNLKLTDWLRQPVWMP